MENLIGKTIRINRMNDELSGHRYNGKEGVVVMVDSMGQLHGTWGSLAVIPDVDDFSVIDGYHLADDWDAEVFEIYLDEVKHPRAFKTKVCELVNAGMTEDEARKFVRETPFVMEVYYDLNRGLFMVESEAVDNTEIYNPYTGVECKKMNDF